jgi:alpha/beta superfamily hydrolase
MVAWLLAGVLGFAFLGFVTASLYAADLFTRPKRRRVQGTPAEHGLRYEDVQFRSPDLVVLRGWFLESPGARATIVLVHNAEGTRADPEVGLLDLQRAYVRNGFNVFAFDLRGRGESGGSRDELGTGELLDLQAAAGYVQRRTEGLPLILHGFGLGASLALHAAGHSVEVAGVIADSPYESVREHLRYRWHRLPAPIFNTACWLARKLYGADVRTLRPTLGIARLAGVPVLLIHGALDHEVPVAQTLNLAAASLSERNDVWIVPEAGHAEAYRLEPQAYVTRCLRLVDAAVPARSIRTQSAAAV